MAFRTKKISQMDPKGSNLASTDLLEISELVSGSYVTKSITGAEIIASVPPSVTSWGTITGALSTQTDLQNALNAKVTSNTAITGATKTKVTYDSKGLVTAGADATTADIADSLNKRYVTDANLTVIGNTSGTNTGDQTLAGLGGVPTTRTLTINGTTQDLSADRTFTVSTGITIGTTAITSGTVGRVLFEGTGNVVQESANLTWDDTNKRLNLNFVTGATNYRMNFRSPELGTRLNGMHWTDSADTNSYGYIALSGSTGEMRMFASGSYFPTIYSNGAERLRIATTGNVLINTTTDAGYKLDVNGTARFNGLVTALLSNYNSTHTGDTTRGFYIVNSADSVIRAGIEYDGTNAFVQLAGRYNNGSPFFRQNGGNGDISFLRNGVEFGRIFGATGNWAINTTTDAGYKLFVNGSGRFIVDGGTVGLYVNSVATFVNRQTLVIGAGDGTAISNGLQISVSTSTGKSYINGWNDGGTAQYDIIIGSGGSRTQFGTDSASVASAQVAINTTTRGFLPPRMTTAQINAIVTPADGLQVYNTTISHMCVYQAGIWVKINHSPM